MESKKITDARSYSHQTREEIRIDAVRQVEAGQSPENVIAGLGMNRRTIYRWLAAYHYGGEGSLAARPIPGAPAKMTGKQVAKLSKIICEKNPLQLKFDCALWTLAMIRANDALTAKATQCCGRILWHADLLLRKSMRLYSRRF